jgi:hypothetical protein
MKSGKGYLTESSLKSSTPLVSHNLPASNSGKTTCPNEISKASLRRSTGESRNHCTLGFRQTFLVPVSWPGSPMQSVTKWPVSGFTKTSMFSRATELPVTLLMAATRSIMSSVLGNVCSWSLINSFSNRRGLIPKVRAFTLRSPDLLVDSLDTGPTITPEVSPTLPSKSRESRNYLEVAR